MDKSQLVQVHFRLIPYPCTFCTLKKIANSKIKKNHVYMSQINIKTKEWATQTAVKIGVEPRCSERVKISCSTNGTCRITHVKICW